MEWSRVVASTGEVVRGVTDVMTVHSWLEKNDEGAFASIATQVSASSTEEVDRLDAALLSFAATNPNDDVRRRLVKFYAVFKIVEMQRYGKFRGLPP